mgnify:CR=1 FL=1
MLQLVLQKKVLSNTTIACQDSGWPSKLDFGREHLRLRRLAVACVAGQAEHAGEERADAVAAEFTLLC